MKTILIILGVFIILLGGYSFLESKKGTLQLPEVPEKEESIMPEQKSELKLTSPSFKEGETIPDKYTCSGDDVNPPLEISGTPQEAQSMVLFVDDPDAPTEIWDHWILFNINPSVTEIEENSIPSSALQGTTSFGKRIYGGPCPPPGPAHRYQFKLYALDIKLNLQAGVSKARIEKAIQGHILAQNQLTGLYGR